MPGAHVVAEPLPPLLDEPPVVVDGEPDDPTGAAPPFAVAPPAPGTVPPDPLGGMAAPPPVVPIPSLGVISELHAASAAESAPTAIKIRFSFMATAPMMVKGRIWNAAAAFDPGTGDRDQNRARPLMPSAGDRYLRSLETNSNLEHVLTLY
jgi:hypothetical protein